MNHSHAPQKRAADHSAPNTFVPVFLAIFGSMVVVVVGIIALNLTQGKLDAANDNRFLSMTLAEELRRSSDDLTRYARLYVNTGKAEFEERYWKIAAIRDGKLPRPDNYNRIYWNFIDVNHQPAATKQRTIALLDMMKEAGFSESELALLAEAKANSDHLIQLETRAMNAVKGIFPDGAGKYTVKGDPDFQLARQLMNSPQYFDEKYLIMRPINDFFGELDRRTAATVAAARQQSHFVLYVLFAIFIASAFVTLFFTYRLQQLVISKSAELQQSENKFRALYESSRDAIMILTLEEGFLGGNPATVALFGCRDEAEFTNMSPAKLSPEFQPDGRRSDEKAAEMMQTAMQTGSHFFEWMHKRVDGTEFPAEVLLTCMQIGGKAMLQATVRDISERKKAEAGLRLSEQRFRDVSEAAGEYLWEIDTDMVYTYVSHRSAEVKGFSPAEMLGHTPLEFMPEEDVEPVKRIVDTAIANKAPFHLQHRDITKSGDVLWEEVNGVPFYDDDGKVIGLRGAGLSITERMAGKGRLRKRVEELERYQAATIQREFRIKELRDEIAALKAGQGKS